MNNSSPFANALSADVGTIVTMTSGGSALIFALQSSILIKSSLISIQNSSILYKRSLRAPYLELQNNGHFPIRTHHFSGAIPYSLCIFNRKLAIRTVWPHPPRCLIVRACGLLFLEAVISQRTCAQGLFTKTISHL